ISQRRNLSGESQSPGGIQAKLHSTGIGGQREELPAVVATRPGEGLFRPSGTDAGFARVSGCGARCSEQKSRRPERNGARFLLLPATRQAGRRRASHHRPEAAQRGSKFRVDGICRLFVQPQARDGLLRGVQLAITSLRLHKEAANSAWTAQELYTCWRLLEDIHSYPEAARYYFALY